MMLRFPPLSRAPFSCALTHPLLTLMTLLMSLSAGVVGVAFTSGALYAEASPPQVLFVPVVATERINKEMKLAFDEHIRALFGSHKELKQRVSLIDLERSKQTIAKAGCGNACTSPRALVDLAKANELARFIFVAEVDNQDEIFSIKVRLFDAGLKKLYKADEASCEFCTELEVKDKLTSAITSAGFLKALDQPGPAPKAPEPPPVFPLKIIASPAGAQVSINGGLIGPAPLQVNLDPGTYKLSVALKGYITQERELKTPAEAPKEPIALSFTLKPEPPKEFQVTLQSTPPGAEVTLDGNPLPGKTPITLKVKPGLHTARFLLDGYELGSKEFSTPEGPEELMIAVQLKADKSAKLTPEPPVTPPVKPPTTPIIEPSLTPPTATPPLAPRALSGGGVAPPPPALLGTGSISLLIGGGLVVGAVGAWLTFIHGDITCNNGETRFECASVYNTRGGGVTLLSAGAISLGVGIGAAIIKASWPEAPTLAPTAITPTRGGAALGWTFDF